jgi:hypothetical protein
MRDSFSLLKAIVLLLVAGVPALHAQDGLGDAFLRLNFACVLTNTPLDPAIATADFDNDTHPDGAILFRNNNTFEIEVHFRSARMSRITFASRFPTLALSAFDVNNDGTPDLVVADPFSRQRLFVWLNDGYGAFHSAHAEDFPAQPDDSCRNLSYCSWTPQSQTLVGAGKSRLRIAPSALRWPLPSPDPLRMPPHAASPLPDIASTPNLLRGPPSNIPW